MNESWNISDRGWLHHPVGRSQYLQLALASLSVFRLITTILTVLSEL